MGAHIYADNAATTPLSKTAFEAMLPWMIDEFGNPSQPYSFSESQKKPSQKQGLLLRNASMRNQMKFSLPLVEQKATTGRSKDLLFLTPITEPP
jgi:hypothetical protein